MAVKDVDKGFNAIVKSLKDLDGLELKVGWDNPELASRAAFAEYGTSTAPARPMVRRAVKSRELKSALGEPVGAMFDGGMTARAVLEGVGDVIRDEIKSQIESAGEWAAPLAEGTIDAKGFDTPLIDTGDMLEGIEVIVS